MSIDLEQYSQVYKITYLPTGQYYAGSTWGRGLPYTKRFDIHMNGKGGIYIKKLIDEGATINDFIVELVFEGPLYKSLEIETTLSCLYPKGLNGNKGKAIVAFDLKKRRETIQNLPKEIKDMYNKKRSDSMKLFLSSLSKDELTERMKKSAFNLTEEQKIERGRNISKSKKGIRTNQREITKQRYKGMTDDDFYDLISLWDGRYKTRAINMRNE